MSHPKIALVTGASRGLGAAIADHLGLEGYTVIGTATRESGSANISARFKEKNIKGQGYTLDVCQIDQIESILEMITNDYGSPTVLVNNAGITRDNLLLRMKEDEWDEVYETNLKSIFQLTKRVLRPMMKMRFGRIVNITSVVGAIGNPGQANYAAIKAGVIGFTKSVAQEMASRGITVNCVAPGFIATDMTDALDDEQRKALATRIPVGEIGKPEDIAQAVRFLVGEEAGYITGQTLHVNGGLYMP
jgi:3-oxoacyl-[acyl-carrier protein] reductase